MRFHKIILQTNAKSFFPIKIFILGPRQYQNKKALFTDPIFSEGFDYHANEMIPPLSLDIFCKFGTPCTWQSIECQLLR